MDKKVLKQGKILLQKAIRHQRKAWLRANQIGLIVPNLNQGTVSKLVQDYANAGKPEEITQQDVAFILQEAQMD